MSRQVHSKEKGKFCLIQTKISDSDRAKLVKIADGFDMTFYQLMQSLLLAIIRYFDTDSTVTDEHNAMVNAFGNIIFSLKDSYSPLALRDRKKQYVNKGILFVERPHKAPQLLAITKEDGGSIKESYNFETMLIDFLGAIDPEMLQALKQTKQRLGLFSLLQTLHTIVLERKPAPADTINEEIKEMFEDVRIATGDKINYDVNYKNRKKTNFEACTAPTMRKQNVNTSIFNI